MKNHICIVFIALIFLSTARGSSITVNPQYQVVVVGSAPVGIQDLADVALGPRGKFFVAASSTGPNGPFTSVLTLPLTPGGVLQTYGTIEPNLSVYGVGSSNLSINAQGKIFLNTIFDGVLTDPVDSGGVLTIFAAAAGPGGRVGQISAASDSSGHIYVVGTTASPSDAVLTDPSFLGGPLSVFGTTSSISSGGPEATPDGRVFVSRSFGNGPGFFVLTNPPSVGGGLDVFGVSPSGLALIVTGLPAFVTDATGHMFTVASAADSTGIVLTDPVTPGGVLTIFGTAPAGITLFPNPVINSQGRLFFSALGANVIFTNPQIPGGILQLFGSAPPEYFILTGRDHSVNPVDREGNLFITGTDGQDNFTVFTDPAVPGGPLTPVATFSNVTRVGNPSVDETGAIYVPVMSPDAPPAIYKFSVALITVNIDIRPGQDPAVINQKSKGQLTVAILSMATFDATSTVNRSSLTFGRTGTEHSLSSCDSLGTDVNGDGIPDLICHFSISQANFQPGDTTGILKGLTNANQAIVGDDTIVVH
ncbi:MAG: hypothetical protein ACJ71U_15765 [Terriglobales bacterium]